MAVINTNLVCDLQNAVKVQYLDGNIFSQDNQGNVINVTVLDGGEPATLSGTISANIIRADGGTVAATGGTITDNVASITLPAAAYAIPGVLSIVIKNTVSSVVTTIAAIVANVYQSSTDTVVDPGTIIPSVQTLISAIETAVASIPADYSSLWTSLAPAFSSSASYVAGQYVTNNGGLYRFTTAHSGAWSSSDVVATNLGSDVSDLKSAINTFEAIENELQSSSVVVGTKTTDNTYYTKLPVTLVNGVFYAMKFTVASDMQINIDLTTTQSTSTIVETLAKDVLLSAGECCFIFKKTSSKVYARIDSNGSIITQGTTITFTKVELDAINNNLNLASTHSESNFVDYGEAMSDMQAVGTSVFSNTHAVQLPGNAIFGDTFYAEFELSSDIDSMYLALNNTSSYSTAKKVIYNNQPLKSGKHGFIFKRTSEMNYLYGSFNDAGITSLTVSVYNVEKNFVGLQLRTYTKAITSSNYLTELPDMNSASLNTVFVGFVSTSGYPANLPITITGYTTFITLAVKQNSYTYQLFVHGGRLFSRTHNGSAWTQWASFYDYIPHYYMVDSSYTDGMKDNNGNILYSSLAKAIEEAIKYPHSTVYVNAGTYDILSEYQALHPEDWSTRNDGRGINLNNGLKLIFSSKAVVECKYTGNDTSVLTNFSAFNVRYGDAEIINANIDASRVRYCVHDDMYSSSSPYHVAYRNCIMKIDNSQNPERSTYPHCIGGGFGKNAHIVIENCIFDGIGGDGTNPAPADNAIVNWHNGPNASQKSDLFMNGCYFKGNGTFGASSHGTATEVSTLLISGNSFGSPIIDRDLINVPTQKNIEIIAFNNEIRTE